MTTTEQLASFTQFAHASIASDSPPESLTEIWNEWRLIAESAEERMQFTAAIEVAENDIRHGFVQPVSAVLDRLQSRVASR